MISVIIPCYNSEQFVTRAIESVIRQTYKDYEIILVDNGSTDSTKSILESYVERFPERIKALSEQKKGAPAARNKGLYEAKGEWLQFLDADDELLPGKLSVQFEKAERLEGNLVLGNLNLKFIEKGYKRDYSFEKNNVWRGLIRSRLGKTSSLLWRKSAVIEAGGWDEQRTSSQEYDLLFRMLKRNDRVAFCEARQTNIYKQENSIHITNDKRRTAEVCKNNIQLRLDIRDYLRSENRLTRKLDYDVSAYIYSYLMGFNKKLPEFVTTTLQQLQLNLPPSFFMKRSLRTIQYKIGKYMRTALGQGKMLKTARHTNTAKL